MKTIVGTETWEETKARWGSIAQKLDRGERVAPVRRIMFEHPADLLDHLTPARRKLLSVVREHPDSVTAVATRLQRPRSAVNRDVQAMQKVGLLKLKKQVNPGHGVVQVVTAPRKVELRATL